MQVFSRFLDTDGDGGGTKDMAADYSDDPGAGIEEFLIQPPAGTIFAVHRLIISAQDADNFKAGGYGGAAGNALANGMELKVLTGVDTVAIDLTDGDPVKTNAAWGKFCYDVDLKAFGSGSTEELLVARWTFTRSGRPIILNGDNSDRLVMTVNDDLSALTNHQALVQGVSMTPDEYAREWR